MIKSKILSKYPKLFHYFGDKNDLSGEDIVTTEQVHGSNVDLLITDNIKLIQKSDGLVTCKAILLGIRTADCLPVFFFDPQKKIVAAVHAGWKGLYEGIIQNSISKMKKLGAKPEDIKAAVGPHIQVCCYNVPKARIDKFKISGKVANKQFLDLGKIAFMQMKSFGLSAGNIDISPVCTSCDVRFWSYRRDKEKAGRMINVIGLKNN